MLSDFYFNMLLNIIYVKRNLILCFNIFYKYIYKLYLILNGRFIILFNQSPLFLEVKTIL